MIFNLCGVANMKGSRSYRGDSMKMRLQGLQLVLGEDGGGGSLLGGRVQGASPGWRGLHIALHGAVYLMDFLMAARETAASS
jgi:hypothetical protein